MSARSVPEAIDCFFWRPVPIRPLAWLRISTALLLLIHFFWMGSAWLELEGENGLVPWALADRLGDPWVPSLFSLGHWLHWLGLSAGSATLFVLGAYLGGLIACLLGWHTRIAAFCLWASHLCLMNSGMATNYGLDQFVNITLFYLLLLPVGHDLSLDRAFAPPGEEPPLMPALGMRALQIHLSLAYLAAGVEKALGAQWWNGEAIWQALMQPAFQVVDLRWLAAFPTLAKLLGWGTLLVEIGYPFLIWPRRTRTFWCWLTLGLHLGIAAFLGLWFFSAMMGILTFTVFYLTREEEPRAVPAEALLRLAGRLGLLLAGAAFLASPTRARAATALDDSYEAIVHSEMKASRIPGLSVGVVDASGLIYARSFGSRDGSRPVTRHTSFGLGSLTKAFTATALAMLVEKGQVDWDAPVRRYLPDFTLADAEAARTLTVKDLLLHRSGLPRHDWFWYRSSLSSDELYARLRFLEPSAPPRNRWRYDSFHYVVLGRLIARVSGTAWESFIEAHLLAPLAMTDATLSPEANTLRADFALPYTAIEGSASPIDFLRSIRAIAPAGSLNASLDDLAHWLRFQLGDGSFGGRRLLQAKTLARLHTGEISMGPSPIPEITERSYAQGWIAERYRGRSVVAHSGAIDGFLAHLAIFPDQGLGLIFLLNQDMAVTALNRLAYEAYDRLLELEPIDWEKRLTTTPEAGKEIRPSCWPTEIAATYVGTFSHPAYGEITIGSTPCLDARQSSTQSSLWVAFRGIRIPLSRSSATELITVKGWVPGVDPVRIEVERGESIVEALKIDFNQEADALPEIFRRVPRRD